MLVHLLTIAFILTILFKFIFKNIFFLVSTPPIIPENAGKCIISQKSGREICYPSYTELDTTCTDYNEYPNSVVQPINIPHAT